MQVNNNGLLSFLQGVSLFTPEPFPLSGNQRVIAPYWADVDTRGTGTVWFRITTNSSLLARARDEIAAFLNQEEFSPAYLFIATWDHVGYFLRHTDRVGCLKSNCVLWHIGVCLFSPPYVVALMTLNLILNSHVVATCTRNTATPLTETIQMDLQYIGTLNTIDVAK